MSESQESSHWVLNISLIIHSKQLTTNFDVTILKCEIKFRL